MELAILAQLQQLLSTHSALDMCCAHQARVTHMLHGMYVCMVVCTASLLLGIRPVPMRQFKPQQSRRLVTRAVLAIVANMHLTAVQLIGKTVCNANFFQTSFKLICKIS
jgi:hypothetical protein